MHFQRFRLQVMTRKLAASLTLLITTSLSLPACAGYLDKYVPKGFTDTEIGKQLKTTVENGLGQAGRTLQDVVNNMRNVSGDQEKLEAYSRTGDYVATGTITGLLTGVGANCIANVTREKKCLKNAEIAAVVGGGLGAVGGWFIASEQRKKEGESVELEQQLNSARLELNQSQRMREAAEKISSEQSKEIERLTSEKNKGAQTEAQLAKKIDEAKKTLSLMSSSQVRLSQEINSISQAITIEKDANAKREFTIIRDQMLQESEKVQAAINLLNKHVI